MPQNLMLKRNQINRQNQRDFKVPKKEDARLKIPISRSLDCRVKKIFSWLDMMLHKDRL